MELKEVYEKIGGDYDDVVRRLMGEQPAYRGIEK